MAMSKGLLADLDKAIKRIKGQKRKKKDPSRDGRTMVVQSIVLRKDCFSYSDAKFWVKGHGYKYDDVDEKENTWRFRQYDPSIFDKMTFRMKYLSDDKCVMAVIAKVK
jgi:hypothetical protein